MNVCGTSSVGRQEQCSDDVLLLSFWQLISLSTEGKSQATCNRHMPVVGAVYIWLLS
jgi:hypothetical protein